MKNNSALTFIIFLVLNFGALALGSWLAGNPSTNEWYQGVNKAPWTPPGWVFGVAWFTIMALFTVFMWKMAKEVPEEKRTFLYLLFGIQWVLNVLWNPVFFRYHYVLPGLMIIIALWAVVIYFMVWGFKPAGYWALLVLPYVVWLGIATSLNGYILLKN